MQFLLPLVLVGFLLLMWLSFRGQQRRQRELAHMQATLEVGDEVMLTSGIYGVLRSVDDARIELEISDGVVVQVARGAVGEIVIPSDDEQDDEYDEHDDEQDDRGDGWSRTVDAGDGDVSEEK